MTIKRWDWDRNAWDGTVLGQKKIYFHGMGLGHKLKKNWDGTFHIDDFINIPQNRVSLEILEQNLIQFFVL